MKVWRAGNYEVTIYEGNVFFEIVSNIYTYCSEKVTYSEILSGKFDVILKKEFNNHVLNDLKKSINQHKEEKWYNGGNKIILSQPQITFCEPDRFGGTGITCSLTEFNHGTNQSYIKEYMGNELLMEIIEYINTNHLLEGENEEVDKY